MADLGLVGCCAAPSPRAGLGRHTATPEMGSAGAAPRQGKAEQRRLCYKVSAVSQNRSLPGHCLPVWFFTANETKILTFFGCVEYCGLLQQPLKDFMVTHLEKPQTNLSKMGSEFDVG